MGLKSFVGFSSSPASERKPKKEKKMVKGGLIFSLDPPLSIPLPERERKKRREKTSKNIPINTFSPFFLFPSRPLWCSLFFLPPPLSPHLLPPHPRKRGKRGEKAREREGEEGEKAKENDRVSGFNYERFNRNSFSIHSRSWNYRGCWHQTCPPIVTCKGI